MIHCYSYLIKTSPENFEILIAELYLLNADAFQEHELELEVFIEGELDSVKMRSELIENYLNENSYPFQKIIHERKDWNTDWESNFKPFQIGHQLLVRAPFHPQDPSFEQSLIIFPKMAFGTGHHETTSMILEYLIGHTYDGKTILDFGCGTGILGILTAKRGASSVCFIDNDPLCVENTLENIQLNALTDFPVLLGSTEVIPDKLYDCIIANITRNILLETLPILNLKLKPGGEIILSGFLLQDFDEMLHSLNGLGLNLKYRLQKGDWLCLIAEKE